MAEEDSESLHIGHTVLLTFNKKLLIWLLALCVVLTIRLVLSAQETGNWHGAQYTFLHLFGVAVGSWFLLKK